MAVLKMWGNSAAVRIPSALLEAAHLSINQQVEVRAEAGRIVIEPAKPSYNLDELLAAVTPQNMPSFNPHSSTVGAEAVEW
jgi:antitoxin MazE